MIQRLFGLLFLATVGWLIGRLLDSARRRAPAPHPSGPAEGSKPDPRSEGTMVRDRVCNKFLPRSRALVLASQGQEHFFCSEKCRRQFLAGDGRTNAASAPTG